MPVRRRSLLGFAAAATAVGVLLASCEAPSAQPAPADLSGSTLEVLATWSDVEQQRFERVLDAFEASTGAVIHYKSVEHKMSDTLAPRIRQGNPPDVAFLPQPGLLRQYAAADLLVPLDAATSDLVAANYSPTWRTLAAYGGRDYGVWFKAANKSLIWYDVAAFERIGAAPPTNVPRLLEIARSLSRAHLPAFAVAGGDAWTLSDWFENLYLRLEGPRNYDLLAAHRIPWSDGSVVRTLRLLAELLAPSLVAGGLRTAVRMTFAQSVVAAFGKPARAAMVAEGDFVAALVVGSTDARLGVDVDVFPFPSVGSSPPMVVGGGDVAVLMRPSRAGAAFLRYLATADAAAIWASAGGFISPNLNLDLSVYPDGLTRAIARALLEAGDEFRFDLSDLQPALFGGSDRTGMRKELQRFLLTRDPETTAARLEVAARAAFAGATDAQP